MTDSSARAGRATLLDTIPAVSRPVPAVSRPVPAGQGEADLAALLLAPAPAPSGNVAFVTGADGFVGWGSHARLAVAGPDAARQIAAWFADVLADLDISDEVGVPGSGPLAFVSLGFDDADESVAVVPSVVLGHQAGVSFRTVIGSVEPVEPAPVGGPGRISYADAGLSVAGFTSAVAGAVRRIRRGELAKVVLAHDLEATTGRQVDERFLLARLAAAYPTCWTFAVAGLVGATPEMLVRRMGTRIDSRVLAGTAWPEFTRDAVADGLMSSAKDLAEHTLAVSSVVDALAGVVEHLEVPGQPHPLTLANLTHLATDLSGILPAGGPTALELAARLHPTAAVGGTPGSVARALIRELEPTPRGRYAAPVGWLDAAGDGEFAIALRCAQITGRSVRLLAGCGIVAGSDPAAEAREAQVKMLPIRDALESSAPG